ncbi:MAG TPA: rhomboid family intramembrane serine protease [Blastocatellia bacterium]|nr:rhomboid family intramembrane serine protease [Blastocatellia bacterium]
MIDASLRTCPLCGRDSVPDAPVRAAVHAERSNFVTMLLLGITVVIYVLMSVVDLSSGTNSDSVLSGASVPVLLEFGARFLPSMLHGEWWRFVTPIFIHIGLIHLGFNCYALYQIGPYVEEAYGSQKFIFIFVLTGVIGILASVVYSHDNGIGAGASGAVMGLAGLLAVYGHRAGGLLGRSLTRQMLFWVVVTFAMGFAIKGIDNAGHFGGLASGAALGYLLVPEHPRTQSAANMWNGIAIACAALIAVSFVMVGVSYGKDVRGSEIVRLNGRLMTLSKAFDVSTTWKTAADGDPHAIAANLRSAASDVQSIKHIDSTLDAIKDRLVEVANHRATVFDGVDKDPSGPVKSAESDMATYSTSFNDYNNWVSSHLDEYDLRKTGPPN